MKELTFANQFICLPCIKRMFNKCFKKTHYACFLTIFYLKEFNTFLCYTADRSGLTDRDLVEQIQRVNVDALEEYENKKRVKGGCALAKYLLRLVDIRNISLEHSKIMTTVPINEVIKDIYIHSDN